MVANNSQFFGSTFWYSAVPIDALLTTHQDRQPAVRRVTAQMVWCFQYGAASHAVAIAAINYGQGWEYKLLVVSGQPSGGLCFSLSPFGVPSDARPTMLNARMFGGDLDPYDRQIQDSWAIQVPVDIGTDATHVTFTATLVALKQDDPHWNALPGFPDTGMSDIMSGLTQMILLDLPVVDIDVDDSF